ncbi:MAG: hypothetical protein NTX64_13450 [Elusimicrobia bacterium]|nr:hypothetical protein [Elusimicrobiota bacterium]
MLPAKTRSRLARGAAWFGALAGACLCLWAATSSKTERVFTPSSKSLFPPQPAPASASWTPPTPYPVAGGSPWGRPLAGDWRMPGKRPDQPQAAPQSERQSEQEEAPPGEPPQVLPEPPQQQPGRLTPVMQGPASGTASVAAAAVPSTAAARAPERPAPPPDPAAARPEEAKVRRVFLPVVPSASAGGIREVSAAPVYRTEPAPSWTSPDGPQEQNVPNPITIDRSKAILVPSAPASAYTVGRSSGAASSPGNSPPGTSGIRGFFIDPRGKQ